MTKDFLMVDKMHLVNKTKILAVTSGSKNILMLGLEEIKEGDEYKQICSS